MGAALCESAVRQDFSGNWRKDKSASQMECYSRQLDLLQLQGVQKSLAQKLINGLQIQQSDQGTKCRSWLSLDEQSPTPSNFCPQMCSDDARYSNTPFEAIL